MPDPQIRYVRTSDGANIAYSTFGSGPPIVYLGTLVEPPFQGSWRNPNLRANREIVGRGQTLVTIDERGVGLSAAYDGPASFESLVADCRAVVEALAPEPVTLYGAVNGAMVAAAVAAELPDRVSHLIAWMPAVTGEQALAPWRGVFALMDQDYRLFTEALWKVAAQFEDANAIERHVDDVMRELPESVIRQRIAAIEEADISDALPRIQCPTLLIQARGTSAYDIGITQDVAQRIPQAEIQILDQTFGYTGESAVAMRDAFDAFLGTSQPDSAIGRAGSSFRTILFTDVEASTALTDRFGDAKARDLLREHETLTRDALAANGGTEIKTMGDGFMASFTSASSALDAAIAMQQAITAHFAETRDADPHPRGNQRRGAD